MIKNTLFICLIIFNVCLKSQNFSATYGFVDVSATSGNIDPSAVPLVNGIALGSFSAIGVSSNPSASGRFSYNNWPVGGINGSDNYGDFSGALSPFAFYKVSLTVLPGYTLHLNSVSFDVRRSGTGARNYSVRSDRDNFTNNLAASTGTNNKLAIMPNDIFFWNYDSISTASDQKGSLISLGDSFQNITNTVNFHFYAWNSESGGGSFSLDNVSFKGSVLDSLGASNLMSLEEENLFTKVVVYPNPSTDGIFNLQCEDEIVSIEVFTCLGKQVKEISMERSPAETQLSFFDQEPGIYYLRITTQQGNFFKRLFYSKAVK